MFTRPQELPPHKQPANKETAPNSHLPIKPGHPHYTSPYSGKKPKQNIYPQNLPHDSSLSRETPDPTRPYPGKKPDTTRPYPGRTPAPTHPYPGKPQTRLVLIPGKNQTRLVLIPGNPRHDSSLSREKTRHDSSLSRKNACIWRSSRRNLDFLRRRTLTP